MSLTEVEGKRMNKEFFVHNRKKLMEGVEDNSILVLFAGEAPHKSADEHYDFAPNKNFYYLTGIEREKIILVITKLNGAVEEKLFIEKSDPVLAKWVGERIKPEEAREVSGIEKIEYLDDFQRFFGYTMYRPYENLYLDLEREAMGSPMTIPQNFANDVIKKYPYMRVKNIYGAIENLRMLKAPEEIEKMKKAIGITYDGIKNMMKNAKPGMMEYGVEAYFDFTLKSNGVGVSFKTIAAAGKNGTVLHYSDNNCKIGDNDLILCDLGAQYGYYCADITRTFPVNGTFTARQKAVYNVVLKALNEVTNAIKPGVPYGELNELCRRVLAEGCKELGIIKDDSELSKYYFHGVSHYLGLDTHDVGVRMDLKPGMVLTVEPGLYIEEEGIGIRIEDDVLVTENGHEVLSKDIIRTAEEIETFMKR